MQLTDQIKADQALRDAAPELLEACKALIRYDESRSVPASCYRNVLSLAKAAIAKAQPTEINETI